MGKHDGERFGRLTLISSGTINGRQRCLCLCDCGKYVELSYCHVITGHTRSCGCLKTDVIKSGANTRHGECYSRLYSTWRAMWTRCRDKSNDLYGGRGISVCPEWEDYKTFAKWAKESGYSDGLSIDRIDVNGDYCPENCRWANQSRQNRNKRNTLYLSHNGETKPLADWCDEYGIKYPTAARRLRRGYPSEAILSQVKAPDRIDKYYTPIQHGTTEYGGGERLAEE